MSRGILLAALLMATAGCMHPMPPGSWRLAPDNVLTPPGVAGPNVTQNIVQTAARSRATCPGDVRARGRHIKIAVTRDGLNKQPRGWITSWAEDLEAQGCIPDGDALRLANQIAQSVPLDMNAAFRLLHPADGKTVQLNPGVRLQIMTPITREGVPLDAALAEVEGPPANSVCDANTGSCSLSLSMKFTDNVLGYEVALYAVQSKDNSPGVSVTPASAERHIGSEVQKAPQPIRNYFDSMKAARFYEVFYKAGQTEFTALLVGGQSKADLERRTKLLETGVAACETLNNEMCVTVPKRVAINPMVVVKVNGAETTLPWGANLGAAIRAGKEQQPNTVLSRLSILKPYADRTAPVEFDPSNLAILNMILMGGENISWK